MKVSIRKYAEALVEVLKNEKDTKEVNAKIQNLLKILVRKKQGKLIKQLPEAFKKVWMKEKGQLEVKATLPHRPTDEEKLHLIKTLGAALKKEIILSVAVDENVLGGIKLEFEDYIIDSTLKGSLEMLKFNLTNSNN